MPVHKTCDLCGADVGGDGPSIRCGPKTGHFQETAHEIVFCKWDHLMVWALRNMPASLMFVKAMKDFNIPGKSERWGIESKGKKSLADWWNSD